jgi:hypothetical protein
MKSGYLSGENRGISSGLRATANYAVRCSSGPFDPFDQNAHHIPHQVKDVGDLTAKGDGCVFRRWKRNGFLT